MFSQTLFLPPLITWLSTFSPPSEAFHKIDHMGIILQHQRRLFFLQKQPPAYNLGPPWWPLRHLPLCPTLWSVSFSTEVPHSPGALVRSVDSPREISNLPTNQITYSSTGQALETQIWIQILVLPFSVISLITDISLSCPNFHFSHLQNNSNTNYLSLSSRLNQTCRVLDAVPGIQSAHNATC